MRCTLTIENQPSLWVYSKSEEVWKTPSYGGFFVAIMENEGKGFLWFTCHNLNHTLVGHLAPSLEEAKEKGARAALDLCLTHGGFAHELES